MIEVLDLSTSVDHTSELANIDGDFNVTRFTGLSGVDLSLFNILYMGEHMGFNPFGGREADVAAAMTEGKLGLVVENDSDWAGISTVLGETITPTADSIPLALTAAGSAHSTFTGAGIPGGSAPVLANILPEDAFSAIPSGATVLVQDNAGNPVTFIGTLGLSSYFITNFEMVEEDTSPSSSDAILLAHNAIHFASVASVEMLNTSKLKIRGWQCHYKVLGRVR